MTCDTSDNVQIVVEVNLANVAVLWDITALEATERHAMTCDEIAETFGPREDPDASACVALLFDAVTRRIGPGRDLYDHIALRGRPPRSPDAAVTGSARSDCFRDLIIPEGRGAIRRRTA